ncbi:acylneuraminate cytidylyltransferase family protein [Candidatus Woesearchaeota archaeon]|nr:acylneuraminate cytidylyltransferase family protein [Candidatus Woesearchaeota archaeon]
MYKNIRVLAVVPARGGSKGIPKKNIIELNGKPLIAWTIEAGKQTTYIDRMIVSTDSKEIAEVAKRFKADVPFIRPDYLSSDTASSVDVLLHAIDYLEEKGEIYDYIMLLEPTSPLRTTEDIEKSIEMLESNTDAESIVGVAKAESSHPLFSVTITDSGFIRPFSGEELKHIRRQDIKDVYFLEGTIYTSKIDALRKRKTFYHERTLPYIVERYKQFEVDEETDLVCIEALMRYKKDVYR